MARYLLSIYQPDGDPPPPEVLEEVMGNLAELNDEMREAGVWVFATGLTPPSAATVLRDYNGQVMATDGPYAETKEHVGGFTIIETTNEEAALEWGTKLARVVGLPIEVRPLAEHLEEE